MSLRFFRRWTCNRSEPGECCKAEIAASRSRCSCCKRASCSRNSRSSSWVIATAEAWAAAKARAARAALRPNEFQVARFAGADHPHGRPPTPGPLGPGDGRSPADGRQSCTTDLRPCRDRYPQARYPKILRKVSFFACPRSSRPVEAVLLHCTSGTHFENGAKWCTLLGSGNNLTEENPPTCPYKRTLRSSSDGTRPWKRKLPKPARIRRSTIFRSLS